MLAKATWGYDRAAIDHWVSGRDFSNPALLAKHCYVAEVRQRVIAWTSIECRADAFWIDDMWVEPRWMRRGVGTRLFQHAADLARALGVQRLEWEAELDAIGFYEQMGGRAVHQAEPGLFGPSGPVMALDLPSDSANSGG